MKQCCSCLFILSILIHTSVLGQSPHVFHHLSTSNGLSNNRVKSIIKDSYGFLWIGTESGLNRYDGYRFKLYNASNNVADIFYDDIQGLQEDKAGNIWIETGNNYLMYNRSKDCIVSDLHPIMAKKGIYLKHIHKIYIDITKNLWVQNSDTLYYYQFSTGQLKSFHCPSKELITMADDGQKLYLMFSSGVLYELDIQKGIFQIVELPDFVYYKIKSGNKLYIDQGKGIWLYSGANIYHKGANKDEWKEIELQCTEKTKKRLITALMDEGNGKIWIATDHKDVFIYNKQNDKQIHLVHDPWIPSSILAGTIEAFYKDGSGTVWLGSNRGLSIYHKSFQNFLKYRNKDFKDINAIMEDQHGNVWLGTDGYGLICKKNDTNRTYEKVNIQENAVVVSLCEDKKGRIWIGTYQDGLFCIENGHIRQFTKENSDLSDNSVWCIKEDRYGYLWIGTLWGAMQRFNPESNEFENQYSDKYENLTAIGMYYDGVDKLYAVTYDGLCILDITTRKKNIHHGNIKGTQHYRHTFLQSVYKDKKDILWIGHNHGLTIWDLKNDTLYFLDKNNGLCDNVIRGICEDQLQHIWVTTSNGCSVLSVHRNNDQSITYDIDNFSNNDGVTSNEFNRHAICQLRNGNMLLGMTDGYLVVNPNKIMEKSDPDHKVTFTGLKIGTYEIKPDSPYKKRLLLDHPMEQTSELKLSYADMLITIEYTTMDLLTADKVNYAYKLENFNSQWIYTSDNQITYTSLPPGKYSLLIKACNGDGLWNEEPTILHITISPPFWLSKYAYALYIILLIGIFIVYRKRLHKNHQHKLEQQQLQIEREQKIRINDMKLKFFTNISHDFRTPLTLIITPLQQIIGELKDDDLRKKINAIYRNAEQLLNMVNELLDFRKLDVGAEKLYLAQGDFVLFVNEIATAFNIYAADRHMNFFVSSEVESVNMLFDTDKIRKIVNNLLSNAFKYTDDEGNISVRIFRYGNSVGVSISDSGMGIPDEEKKHIFKRFYQIPQEHEKTGSGIGLHIANEYVCLHGGNITVENNIPCGSVFTFTIPIIEPDREKRYLLPDNLLNNEQKTKKTDQKKRPMLLLVEDNKEFREFMSESLSNDFDVLVADNGQEALVHLKESDVDCVISDVMMPVIDGLNLCKQIKTNIHWSHIPVILLTARAAEECKIQSLEYGADDYITKPFNLHLLKLRIQKFMEWNMKCHQTFNQKLDFSPSEITITSLDEQLIAKSLKIIEEHMDNPDLSVELLSAAVGLTRGHLYKKLMHITGKSPQEFIKTIRLKRAKQLLEKSQLQIAEVAYAVGFNSPKVFTHNFRNEFGISPSQYLKKQK